MGVRGIVIRGALTLAVGVSCAAPAHAALQDFAFAGCFGAEVGCTPLDGLPAGDDAPDVAVSADGADVYAISAGGATLQHLRRATDGSLSPAGCFKEASAGGSCEIFSGDFSGLTSVAIPPDGEHVYVGRLTEVATIIRFDRDPATGQLTAAPGPPFEITSLADVVDVEAPTDVSLIVATTGGEATVVRLDRLPVTGQLQAGGSPACMSTIAEPVSGWACSIQPQLTGLTDVAAAEDAVSNLWLFATSSGGSITAGRVAAAMVEQTSCVDAAGDCGAGNVASLAGAAAVDVLPGAPQTVVVAAPGADAVTQLVNGASLAAAACIEAPPVDKGCAAADAKLGGVDAVAAAADGEVLYAASSARSSVVEIQPSRPGQAIAAGACAQPSPAADCAGRAASAVGAVAALSTSGTSLYAAGRSGGLAVFRRGAPPSPPPPPPPPAPVAPAQRAPSCVGASVTLTAGRATAVPLTCTDPDGDVVTRQIVDAPAHAVLDPLDQAAGTVTVTPDATYRGLDSLIFRATDAGGRSSGDATVAIRVAQPNAPPALTRVTRVRVPASVRAHKSRRGRLTVRWRQGSASDVLLTFHRIDSRGRSEQQVPAVVLDNGQRGANRATVVLPRTIVDGRYRVLLRAVSEDGREGSAARSRIFRVSGTGRGETGARR